MDRIGKYTVEKVLGEGGFGTVYLAHDPDVGQPVAIKRLKAKGDSDLLRRFQFEIRTTARLRHKNIVTIHASGEESGDPYLVMEFLEGHTLKQVIKERWPLSLLDKVRIMTQIAEGLAYAHSKGVVHRDVKPENIMLMPDENIKIMDFGIALGPERMSAVTQTGGIIGTPFYFAPELIEGYKANEQTDIFSYGDVCYELLAGVHPFEQYKKDPRVLQIAISSYEPKSLAELLPGCPEALEMLVHRTLAKQPGLRYQRFDEIKLDSEAILVDLKHEEAAVILREIPPLIASGNLQRAWDRINQAYELEPGNRDTRRVRDEINRRIHELKKQEQVAGLLAEADRQIQETRFAEAVRTLEAAGSLDTGNFVVAERLKDARTRLENYNRVQQLISEARLYRQKGQLTEAQGRLHEALAINPAHTDAIRLIENVQEEINRRRLEQQRQQAIRVAREHLSARQFTEALVTLDQIDRILPGAEGVAELRAEIQYEQEEDQRRQRAERFNLALSKTREVLQAGDIERAQPMLDHLYSEFASEPGASELLRRLSERLANLVRARDIAQYQASVRNLLKEKSFRQALELVSEARRKFPDDSGLERLSKQAEESYRSHRRAQALASVRQEASAKREAGDLQAALDTVNKGRLDLGDDAALVELAGQIELEIEQQRYLAALDRLLSDARALMNGGKHADAVQLLLKSQEFSGEAEVRALLDSARAAAAIAEERRFVQDALAVCARLQSEGSLRQAHDVVEKALGRYPHNLALVQAVDRSRARIEAERRRVLIERHRAVIRAEIGARQWKRAEAALRQARSEFAGESAFDELGHEVDAGLYEENWRDVENRFHQNLDANAITEAQVCLEEHVTRTVYAQDPRWQALAQELARRQEYENALAEAERQRGAGLLVEAEQLLTQVINQGPPDKRALQMRGAIQSQRSEIIRQQDIARIAFHIRECVKEDDVKRAETDLRAARARYPGEAVWNALQSELDARQQVVRRQADIAEAEHSIGEALEHDDIQRAASILSAARNRYPDERSWPAVEARIHERREILNRRQEMASIAATVRSWLERKDAAAAGAALDAARVRYPGERLWDTLRSEVDARRGFLAAQSELADGIRQHLKRKELDLAEAELARARNQCPDEDFWRGLDAEIGHLREEQRARAQVAAIVGSVLDHLHREDVQSARAALDAGRARYPGQDAWSDLLVRIEAREREIKRRTEIEEIADAIRSGLEQDIRAFNLESRDPDVIAFNPFVRFWAVLRNAQSRLDRARAKYQSEPVWDAVQAEISGRQSSFENEILQVVRSCNALRWLDQVWGQLKAARQAYASEPFWAVLESEIEARRGPLERAALAEAENAVREAVQRADVNAARTRLESARKNFPSASWESLQKEINVLQGRLDRERDLEGVERRARELLQAAVDIDSEHERMDPTMDKWEVYREAASLLDAALGKYPGESGLLALRAEVEAGRARLCDGIEELYRSVQDRPELLNGWLLSSMKRLCERYPEEPLFARMKPLVAAAESQRARMAEVAAIVERVRAGLKRNEIAPAEAELDKGRAKYPDEASWSALQGEIDAAKAAELERRRQIRLRDRDRLVAIEREIAAEPRKRKRNELDREAQQLVILYPNDQELRSVAARIHSAATEASAAPKETPWKLIGGIGVAAAAAAILFTLFRDKPAAPVKPSDSNRPVAAATVAVEIRTDPPGASVRVADRTCVTPNCRLDLTPGSYQVSAELRDYEPKQQTVRIDAANRLVDLSLTPVQRPAPPPPSAGTLIVQAGVPDALVFVDGAPQRTRTNPSGNASLSLEAKAHEVRVERNGYEKAPAQRVNVTADATRTVVFHLNPEAAHLQLIGAPANVEVTVDGGPRGAANVPLTLKPGPHSVSVHPGRLDAGGAPVASLTLNFEPGQTVRLTWKPEPAAPTPTPPVQSTPAPVPVSPPAPAPKTPSKEELIQQEWDKIRQTSDLKQLHDFRAKYPGSRQAMEADHLAWDKTGKDAIDSLRIYVQEFPDGGHAAEARMRIDDLLWARVDKSDPEQVRKFLTDYPASARAGDAKTILNALEGASSNVYRTQVLDRIRMLNEVFQKKPVKDADVKPIWPSNARKPFVDALRNPGEMISLTPVESPRIQGTTAMVHCKFSHRVPEPKTQDATVVLRYAGGSWFIEDVKVNP